MIVKKGKIISLFLIVICVFSVFFFEGNTFGQQAPQKKQNESKEEKLIPSPKNIKENTAIHVFIGWMWLAIFILIYILRLKVKEADRLYKLRFFLKEKTK